MREINWLNPREKIWGFHVHQELSLQDFAKALVIQQQCGEFLQENAINANAKDVIKPGYGPHLDYMWELRVENESEAILEKLGLAIAFMAINRFQLSAYIHPLMHDTTLPEEQALFSEGKENQANALWFSYRVAQNQDFFFHPPKDSHNNIIDTRMPRIMSEQEINQLLALGKQQLADAPFHLPETKIIRGFHIHLDYEAEQAELALMIFDNFVKYLLDENLRPSSTRIYGIRENGPHIQGGWEVKFESRDKAILHNIGIAIAWLMCNRQGLSIFMHPVTWEEGNYREEHKAHKEYAFFLGELPALDLSFFTKKFKDQTL